MGEPTRGFVSNQARVIALLALLFVTKSARAFEFSKLAEIPPSGSSSYVENLVKLAIERNGLTVETEPDGKIVEGFVIHPYDVIVPEDPWPMFPAAIHMVTKPYVIEREALLEVGQPWDLLLAQETERNLRANLFLSIARVIPCKGSDPGKVVALIVTKDIWSLRPGFDFVLVGSQLQYLALMFSEQNFLGRRKVVGIDFALDLATFLAGQRYRDPRLFGSRLSLAERFDVIWNKNSGALEGGIAQVSFEKPIYSLATHWGWGVYFDYQKNIYRQFAGGTILSVPAVTTGDSVLYQYRQEIMEAKAELTHSWGELHKLQVGGGPRLDARNFQFYDSTGALNPASIADFNSTFLPRAESMGVLAASARFFRAEFVQLYDIERYSVPEDYRLGPDVRIESRIGTPALGWTQWYWEPDFNLEWTLHPGDALLQGWVRARARFQPGLNPYSDWVTQIYSARIKGISPRFWFLRVAGSARTTRRYYDLDRSVETLGGNNGIRGFPSDFLFGQQVWGANLELRTIPFRIWAFYVGAVTFFDCGNAFGASPNGNAFYSSAGLGLRLGLPQFNRQLLRFDFAIPISGFPPSPSYFVASFGQAF